MFPVAALSLLATLALADPATEQAAEAELETVRARFAERPRRETLAALAALARHWPSATAGGRAELWLGDLVLQDQDAATAKTHFAAVQQRFPDGPMHALAERGLGNVAFLEGHFGDAAAHFRAARSGATPLLLAELDAREHLALLSRRRLIAEFAAWALYLATLLWFIARLTRHTRRQLHFPVETLYVLPLYAVLIVAGWGREPGIGPALLYLGAGSLVLITVAFAVPRAARPLRRVLTDGALLFLANAALFYLAMRRAGLVDVLWETIQTGGEMD